MLLMMMMMMMDRIESWDCGNAEMVLQGVDKKEGLRGRFLMEMAGEGTWQVGRQHRYRRERKKCELDCH